MSDVDLAIDAETRLADQPRDARPELRLWLRLLTCTTMIEREIRRRLAERFQITLPRFDLLAQLDSSPDGTTLGEPPANLALDHGGAGEKAQPQPEFRAGVAGLVGKARFRVDGEVDVAHAKSSSPR